MVRFDFIERGVSIDDEGCSQWRISAETTSIGVSDVDLSLIPGLVPTVLTLLLDLGPFSRCQYLWLVSGIYMLFLRSVKFLLFSSFCLDFSVFFIALGP